MPAPPVSGHHKIYEAELLRSLGPDRERLEQKLLDSGAFLPLPHRFAWARAHPPSGSWFVAIRDAGGKYCFGFAVDVIRPRSCPGHLLLHVERLVPAADDRVAQAALQLLAHHAYHHRRIINVSVQVFSRDTSARAATAAVMARLGCRRRQKPNSYTKTIAIDLAPSEEEIFASFHPTARRHIKALGTRAVSLRPVTDSQYANRLAALLREAMLRTGARAPKHNWATIIEFSNQYPQLSRIIGLFRTDIEGTDSLVAFAWARHHGDHADYAVAASTRTPDVKIPLGYGPAWDLIRWAKRNGATWFDFGGITSGHFGDGDALGGISDFKRYFSRQVVAVSDEWVLEPRPLQARLATALSATAAWVRAATLR
jgi:hypothetical protein